MKNNLTYCLFFVLIPAFCSSIAQEVVASGANKPTGGEPFGYEQGKQGRTIDSLHYVLKTLNSSLPRLKSDFQGGSEAFIADTTKINTLNTLSVQYLNIGRYDQALHYAQQAQQHAEKVISSYKMTEWNVVFKKKIAKGLDNGGYVFYAQANYQRALENFQQSLKIKEEIKDMHGMALSYNNLGDAYYYQGNYGKCLDNYLKSFSFYEEVGNKKGMADAYMDIGYVYLNQNNYEKAFDIFSKELKLSEKIGDKEEIAKSYKGIGDFYEKTGNYQKELESHLKCLKINEEIKNKSEIARSYGNIGNAYFYNGDYTKALEHYLTFLKLNEEIGDKGEIADAYSCIGGVYLKLNKFQESDYYLNMSLSLSKKIGYKESIKETYNFLSELYVRKSDYKKALDYQKLFTEIKDSLLNEKSSKQIAEMNTRYDSEKKDKAIQLLNKEKENQVNLTALEQRKQQVILFSVSGFSLLLMGFALLIYRSFRQKQLLNKELEKLSIVASETDNGVLICGPKGELEWANAALTRLLGYSLEELKRSGNTLEEVSSNPEIKSMIHQSIENKKSAVYQALNITKNGTERWMQSTLTPILDEKGNIKKLVVIDTDVSERKKIEEKLSEQKTELEARTIEIEKQKELVEEKNLKIMDSITYARLIQRSILMDESEIQEYLPDSFIYYQPKDIVSGDFYWFSKVDDIIILAAIDCTGHGVPGAFMSMIGNTLLNQIVNEKCHTKPSEILKLLNIGIYEALHQQKGGALSHDGMDMALCSIDYKNDVIQYAGAQNPLYLVWENQIEVIKADMHTIGGGGSVTTSFDPLKRDYTNHIIPIKKGLGIYIFSDGFMDQFGGLDKKKFGIQQFKDLILNNQALNMKQQKEKIVAAFCEWKGTTSQIDDVLVIGLRL